MFLGPTLVVPETFPKSELPTVVFARPNCGVFVMLNISPRNCAFHRSRNRKFFRIAKSACLVGPKRMLGDQRVMLPISYVPGAVKAAVLNQRSGIGFSSAAVFRSATFGRCTWNPYAPNVFGAVKPRGNPLLKRTMDET